MNLAELTERLTGSIEPGSPYPKSIAFDFGDEGRLLVDYGSGQVDNSDYFADSTFVISWTDFQSILTRTLDPQQAVEDGKMTLGGGEMAGLEALGPILDPILEIYES